MKKNKLVKIHSHPEKVKETFENCKENREFTKNKTFENAYKLMLKWDKLEGCKKDIFPIGWFTIMKQLHDEEIKYEKEYCALKIKTNLTKQINLIRKKDEEIDKLNNELLLIRADNCFVAKKKRN